MIANYHTHTPRCRHAFNPEIEYVETAVAQGVKILGFSDHTPQFFAGEYYSRMRMRPEELQDYVDTVTALKSQYADRLQIHLGLEVEYYPAIFPKLLEVLRDQPIEYMILGQHWSGNEEGEEYNGRPSQSEEKLARYVDQVIEAIHTGLFTYIAHPDILRYEGDPKRYAYHMGRLCKAAKSCQVPLELNLLGIREERHYPNLLFWETAAQEGCQVVLGSDAHRPEQIIVPEAEETALHMVRKYGLELLETVPLRNI